MITRVIYNPKVFDSDIYRGVLIITALETWLKERKWIPEDEEIAKLTDDGDSIDVELMFTDEIQTFYVDKNYEC